MMTLNQFEKKYGVHFTTKHTGKMSGMWSLSTDPFSVYCRERAKNPLTICAKCYAQKMTQYFKGMLPVLERNTEVLSKQIIPVEEWPILNCAFFRFESFGDVRSMKQVVNYFNLCKANPHMIAAVWTKNPGFYDMAIKAGYEKPCNLIIILSSPVINKTAKVKHKFVDKVFTVFDKQFIKANEINVNCGARSCLMCRRCYTKTNGLEYVNEKLK